MTLEKPGASAAAILGGSEIGTDGSTFYLKVIDGTFSYASPAQETTGDGDTSPTYENSLLLYGQFDLTGAMISGQAIGLANIVETTSNPVAMTFDLGGTRRLSATVLIEQINLRWGKNRAFVGVALRGRMTDTDAANVEEAVTAV